MTYVVLQMIVFLLIAGGLGFAAGWMLRGWGLDGSTHMTDGYERGQREALLRQLNTARAERDDARTQMLAMQAVVPCAAEPTFKREQRVAMPVPVSTPRATPSAAAAVSNSAAASLGGAAVSAADDLKRIKGVGPKLEQTLHTMGITRFAQIAAWTDEEVHEVNAKLRFHGRIERDRWIEQARTLAAK